MVALLRSLQKKLPKPLLFGLYGAVGSLLAALVFGEGLWAALAPSTREARKPEPPKPELALTASRAVSLRQGGRNLFTVRIARGHFDGPVQITVPDPPPGVTIPPVVISEKSTSADVEVKTT